jgi:hypothetical protein
MKEGLAHNPTLQCKNMNFDHVSLFHTEHIWHQFHLPSESKMIIVLHIKLGQLAGGRGLSSLWGFLGLWYPSTLLH